jgi:uncharacterized protein YprB with RNaseH-like and TPR domain
VKDAEADVQSARAESSRFEKQYLDERALRRQVMGFLDMETTGYHNPVLVSITASGHL